MASNFRTSAVKPSPSREPEERRKQTPDTAPTTKSPDTTVPHYLRSQLGMTAGMEQQKQEGPRAGIPRYLWGELDRLSTPAPKPSAAPATGTSTAVSSADLGRSEPLAPEAATRFSQAYGQDLSGVRVHPDSPLPGALGSRAFAVGNDIAFARDAYQPGSSEGQQLIGHELAHVVQQSRGQQGLQAEGLSTDGYEHQADEAARAALAGEPVAELSPLATPTVQHKAADAPPPAPPAGRDKPRPGKVPEGVLDLSKGLLDPEHIAPDANGRVLARLPGLAEGEIELVKKGEGYSTRGEGYALPLSVGPLASVLGDSLVLAVRIDNNVISGRAAVGKPGRSVPKGDSALFRAIEKSPEALGWTGLSKLSVGAPKNALEGGSLKLGAESARFTLGGFVEGTGSFSVAGERVTFNGTAEVKLPGASTGRLEVNYSPETGLTGETSLKVGVGKVSGGVAARLRQGVLDIQGTAGYGGDRLKGSVTLVATDAATAQEITRKPPRAGVLPGQEGTPGAGAAPVASKPGPRALCGWGELDFSLTEWLTGRVMVVVNSQGEATVQGEIAPPKEIILFEQKEWTKSLVKVEARALYGLPVVGNVFVFANVGLEALASIGPGKLYNIRMAGQYSTDKQADKELNLQASLNIPAYAGLRLRAEGGAGVELVDHDIKFGVGVWALAGVRGYVEATPTIGYRQKAGAAGEFYIKGHMELAAQPFLGLGGDLFVEVDSPFWSPLPDDKWTWPLGSLEYPLPGEFGLGADVEHVLGSKQWPELQFTEVEFDSSQFMMDLLSGGAPGKSKAGEDKKGAKWNDGGAEGTPGGAKSAPEGKSAAAAPTKAPAGGGKKGTGAKPAKPAGKSKGGQAPKGGKDPGDKGPRTEAPEQETPFTGPIGEQVSFSDGQHGHRMWVEEKGGRATLMVASDPMTVEQRLSQWDASVGQLSDKQQMKRAASLLQRARSILQTVSADSAELAAQKAADPARARPVHKPKRNKGTKGKGGKSSKKPAQQLNQQVRTNEHRLADILADLFLLFRGTDSRIAAPKSLSVEKAALRKIPAGLAREIANAPFRPMSLVDSGEDAIAATRRILSQHSSASYDSQSGQLALPAPKSQSLSQAGSLQQLGNLLAKQTGAPKVTLTKTAEQTAFDVHVQASGTAASVSRDLLFKHVQLHAKAGIRLPNGTFTQLADQTGEMEKVLMTFRSLRHARDFTLKHADDLDANLAMANLQVSGLTKDGNQQIFTHALNKEGVLSIFSSGSGMLDKEAVQLKVIDHRDRELRPSKGLDAEAQKRAPVFVLMEVEVVTVGSTPEEKKADPGQNKPEQVEKSDYDYYLRVAEVIPSDAYIDPQRHKHSEQAIFALFVHTQSDIARWIRSLEIVELGQLVLNIHSERELCTHCAKAAHAIFGQLDKLAPDVYQALLELKAKYPVAINVTSSVEFSQAALKNQFGASPLFRMSRPTVGAASEQPKELSASQMPVSPEQLEKLAKPRPVTPGATRPEKRRLI